jgi:NitT/TauT family transport system permease protein
MRITRREMIKTFYFILPFLIVIGLWELAVDLGMVSSRFVPSPSSVTLKFYRLIAPEPILPNILYMSFYRLILGYALGVLIGISLGILMGVSRLLYRVFSPILSLLISVPTLAWVPLLLVTLGPGEETVVIAIFLGSFFPIVYNTLNGIRSVGKHHVWASQIMGSDKATVFFEVLLPGSLVSIITGLRLAIGYSWRALVGAEMLAAGISAGVGQMIYAARAFNDVEAMFAGLVIIAIGGLLLDRLLMDPIERKTVEKWGMVKER